MKSEGRTVYCGLMQLGISEAVADRIDRNVVLAELAFRRCVGTIIGKIRDLIQGVDLLSEDLGRYREDRSYTDNRASVIIDALTGTKDRLSCRRGSQKQKYMLALDHHL